MHKQSVSATELSKMGKCPTLIENPKRKGGGLLHQYRQGNKKEQKTYAQLKGDYEHWHYEQKAMKFMGKPEVKARKNRHKVVKWIFAAGVTWYMIIFFLSL